MGVKNHSIQIYSSLFHTIQILLSFKPFPLSFALGVWTCWWQSGLVCCKWWVVKVCLVVGGRVCVCVCVGGGGVAGAEGGGEVGAIMISCFLHWYVPEKCKEWFCYIYTRRCSFIYLFILSYDMFYMGCLCIVILSLTDQIIQQDKKAAI